MTPREAGKAHGSRSLARKVVRDSGAALVGLALLVGFAWVLPMQARNPLAETAVWAALVMTAFTGWGSLVRFAIARDERVDLGLRIIWGAGAMCALGGLLATFSWMTRSATFAIVEAGLVLAMISLLRERTAMRLRLRLSLRLARREPGLAIVAAIVMGGVLLHYLAGISEWHTNPYDDDIAYLSFVRRLLDTGSILEPFSLRRLSALGGQSFFLELIAVRAAPSQGHTFDRSVCVVIVVLLLDGFRQGGRRAPWFVTLTTIALLLVLPNVSINTASYYSGIAFFLGLYRTLVWVGRRERSAWKNALPLALVGAAACTLRQNYVIVPALVLGASYAFRFFALRERPLRERLSEPLFAALFSFAALVPWFIVAYQSNLTFFYPVMLGTANPAMQFQSGASTLLREIYLQIWTLLEGLPLKTFAFFVLAAAILREKEPRRPLWSFVIGAAAGFVALVHGLTQGDATNIGRYAGGFLMALALAAVLGTSARRLGPVIGREHVAMGLVVVGVLGGLYDSRTDLYKFYARATHNIEALENSVPRSAASDPPEVALYQRLQDSVPAGARLAIMLDEPYQLNYSRQRIWNLDMPGYASLAPGIPYFKGSEAVEQYFRGLGARYLACVKTGYSRYHYRREYWIQEIADEAEVWRAHAPYVIDLMDNLTALEERHRHLFDERGIVVIDLEAPK